MLLGCMLHLLGAVCGALSWATAGVMPPVAAGAWIAAGFTAWALAPGRG